MGTIVTFVLGVPALAGSANLRAPGETRSRHRLRDESEPFDHLPEGLADKPMYEAYPNEQIRAHVGTSRGPRLTPGVL